MPPLPLSASLSNVVSSDVETSVVTGATKETLGTVTHTFDAKDGCYRLEVGSHGISVG